MLDEARSRLCGEYRVYDDAGPLLQRMQSCRGEDPGMFRITDCQPYLPLHDLFCLPIIFPSTSRAGRPGAVRRAAQCGVRCVLCAGLKLAAVAAAVGLLDVADPIARCLLAGHMLTECLHSCPYIRGCDDFGKVVNAPFALSHATIGHFLCPLDTRDDPRPL
ncbi:hypothetical protein J6590_045892 [Homalodisca vitripennis]|nr:hypothetical protein J6590_045892 [Homalodisca vitripennis]